MDYIQPLKWAGKKICRYHEIDSTNMEARRLAEVDEAHGTVVVAESQTSGRGRRGRRWNSTEGAGLWFSMILRPDILPEYAPALTLVAAMAVTKAVERMTGTKPGIKWPNDLVLSGKKVCGILTEMNVGQDGIKYIILGIGINVKAQEFPMEIADIATALEMECNKKISREQLLAAVLAEFEYFYEQYMQTLDMSLMLEEYNKYLLNLDKQVRVLDPQGAYEGIARGINSTGELLVEREGELIAINSGEVSVRGIYGYV